MRLRRLPRPIVSLTLALAATTLWLVTDLSTQGSTYAVYTADGRRSLPYRSAHGTDMVPLEQLANLFNLSLAEDSLVGGLMLRGRGQTILLIPGQSFASVGPGRIVALPAPVDRDRNSWQVPIDFVRQVLAPTFGLRVEVRQPIRVLLIGDLRLPQITGRFTRLGTAGRLVLDIQPTAPRRVTRQGSRIAIRFEAVALDLTPLTGIPREFVTDVRVEGQSLMINLGPSVTDFKATDTDATHLTIDLLPPAPIVAPTPPAAQTAVPSVGAAALTQSGVPDPSARPLIDTAPGTLRTIVLDPGHGGADRGVVGPGGAVEKDLVLQFAKRLHNAIEADVGIRVIMTRESDEAVPLDRRASIANNNKADLFISLHANGSPRASTTGAQVLSLNRGDYRMAPASGGPDLPVAFLGGGTRRIEVLPWDLAQTGFTAPSAVVRTILQRELERADVPLFKGGAQELALRPLVGASMPAVLLELGFLTNGSEEWELGQNTRQQRTISAILKLVAEIRRGVPERVEVTP